MMNNCFICSRESYDFERHGGVSKIFTSYNITNDCDIILGKKKGDMDKRDSWCI